MNAEQSLRQEIAALQHELRRVNDGLERNRTRDLEWQAQRLRDNIALCERELNELVSALQSNRNRA
jgi:chromosome segregation ATPase